MDSFLLTIQVFKVCQEIEVLEIVASLIRSSWIQGHWILKREAGAGNKAWHDRLSITCGRDRKWQCQESSSTQQLWMGYAEASLHQPAVKEKQLSETPDFPCAWMKCSPQPYSGLLQETIPCLFLPCPLTWIFISTM